MPSDVEACPGGLCMKLVATAVKESVSPRLELNRDLARQRDRLGLWPAGIDSDLYLPALLPNYAKLIIEPMPVCASIHATSTYQYHVCTECMQFSIFVIEQAYRFTIGLSVCISSSEMLHAHIWLGRVWLLGRANALVIWTFLTSFWLQCIWFEALRDYQASLQIWSVRWLHSLGPLRSNGDGAEVQQPWQNNVIGCWIAVNWPTAVNCVRIVTWPGQSAACS